MIATRLSLIPRERVQPSGVEKIQRLNNSNYTDILVSGSYRVELVQGVANIEIKADENFLPYIEIEQEQAKLKIGRKKGVYFDEQAQSPHFTIGIDQIENIRSSGRLPSS